MRSSHAETLSVRNAAEDEFQDLCFQYGIELDDVVRTLYAHHMPQHATACCDSHQDTNRQCKGASSAKIMAARTAPPQAFISGSFNAS